MNLRRKIFIVLVGLVLMVLVWDYYPRAVLWWHGITYERLETQSQSYTVFRFTSVTYEGQGRDINIAGSTLRIRRFRRLSEGGLAYSVQSTVPGIYVDIEHHPQGDPPFDIVEAKGVKISYPVRGYLSP